MSHAEENAVEENTGVGPVLPRTPTEAVVAQVWAELLELDVVDVTEDFFALGGHSMLAVRVVHQLAERTGTPLELEVFFDLATVEEVAGELDRLTAARAHEHADDHVYEGEL
ncbi:phosphopantetheine-binding protein [Actinophytocola sp.]|uniref:phosphopantetheine-binding protein n=1 Tax=Actinophytocola sp. TaxID=1872138 RepID=UPI003899A811